MLPIFFGILLVIALGTAGQVLLSRMRLLDSVSQSQSQLPDVDRYRPMMRLLSDEDLKFAEVNPVLRKKVRAQRREMFRGYLRCLAKDYARVLLGLRHVMVESGVDRPDLAKALAKNRMMFTLMLCRIELSLQLHAIGIGKVDVSGLVGALDALRGAASSMMPATGAAY